MLLRVQVLNQVHTHTRINTHPATFIPSAHSIRGVWELPVPLEKPPPSPPVTSQRNLSLNSQHRRTGRSFIRLLSPDWKGRDGCGRRTGRWEPLPCKAAAPLCPCRCLIISRTGGTEYRKKEKGVGGAASGQDEAASAERKREVKTGEMSRTRSSSMTPYISPSAAPSAARPPTRG